MTGGSSESDENDIKSPTQVSLPDALTTIKREMPLRNDQGKPVHNWNKLCAVVLKRMLGLFRCFNKGWEHYASTIGAAIFTHNVLILSRT